MKLSFLYCFLFLSFSIQAQERPTGMIFDPPSIRSIPYKAKLTASSYQSMPASASLEKYCPTAGDQGRYGTCVAFATAYHMRTILYAKTQSEPDTDGNVSPVNANSKIFSPTYIYEQIKEASDKNCQEGTNPVNAFELMKTMGAATLATQPYSCGSSVSSTALQEGTDFRITDYQILYMPDETDADLKINSVKKALSEGYPCMLGFIVAKSFYNSKGDVWREEATDDGPTGQHGRHAMCVVGYDNNKYGGSFRVLNSWGTTWRDKGYVWIPYADFGKYSILAIQGYGPAKEFSPKKTPSVYVPKPRKKDDEVKPEPVKPEPAKPTPSKPEPVKPAPVKPAPSKPEPLKPTPSKPEPIKPILKVNLSGVVAFQQNTGTPMIANRVLTRNLIVADDNEKEAYKEDLVAYRMDNAYPSGTKFRFFITTNTETFIYAFATDLTGKVNKIMPFEDNMSPRIGANSQVAFPSESKVVKMDNNAGTDYMLILYSQEPLDAVKMLEKMNAAKGGLSQKIKAALGDKLILPSNVTYSTKDIGFDVKKGEHKGTVVPLMVELSHK